MRRPSLPLAIVGYALGGALVVSGLVSATGAGAAAAVDIDNGLPGVLTLESPELSGWSRQMDPGDVVHWEITAVLDVATEAELTVTLEHSGELAEHPDGLVLLLERCSEPWTGEEPRCPPGAEVVADGALESIPPGTVVDLGLIARGDGPYFLATLSLPERMPATLQGTSATIALGFTAMGDTTSATIPGRLPNTGSADRSGLLAACSGLVVLGLVLALRRGTSTRGGR